MVGAEGTKKFYFDTLDCWKRHFREKNYTENYSYLLKSTKSAKTTSPKFRRNIIWADFLGAHTAQTISKRLGLPVLGRKMCKCECGINNDPQTNFQLTEALCER